MYLKKSLGQHILVAEPTVKKIVRTLAPTKGDTVIEIGPGTGNMTRHLAGHAGRVIAIEKDGEMVEILRSKVKNIEIIHADFLEMDLASLFPIAPSDHPTIALFCGNIPYNISTPILFKLKDNKKLFSRGVLTVQREVADRLVATPGSKEYGILTIMMQVASMIEKSFDISAKSFIPRPKVVSSVVKIEFPDPPPYEIKDEELFARIVKSVFRMRRKMIRNSIPKEYLSALETADIDPTRRPETLSIEEFVRIAG